MSDKKKLDPSWRKALVGAQLLLHSAPPTPRRVRVARALASDPAVTPRLLDQAVACICARKAIPYPPSFESSPTRARQKAAKLQEG